MAVTDRSDSLDATLRRLCLVVEEITACVVVDGDGFVLAAYPADDKNIAPPPAVDARELAALAATLAGMGERTMDRLAQGKIGRLVLEGEAGTLLTCPVGSAALAVLVTAHANLAHVLFAAQKAAAEIESVLFHN